MTKIIGMILVTVCLSAYCCSEKSSYVKGVQKDSQQIFDRKKEFFIDFAFVGVIDKKKYCENCKVNKYQIVIKLNALESDSVEMKDKYFQPYYFLDKPNQLNLSVTKNLYESITETELVRKEKNSIFLNTPEGKYQLLNEKKLYWMPD